MFERRTRFTGAALLCLGALCTSCFFQTFTPVHAGETLPAAGVSSADERTAAAAMPDGAVTMLTLRDGRANVEQLNAFLEETQFMESPVGRLIASSPQYAQGRIGLLGIAAAAELEPAEAVGILLGDGACIGLYTRDDSKELALLAVSTLDRAPEADRLIRSIEQVAGLRKRGRLDPKRSKKIGDVMVVALDDNLLYARDGSRLIVCSNGDLMQRALKLKSEQSMQHARSFIETRSTIPSDAAAWLYTDPAQLETVVFPGGLGEMLPDPLAGMLFGGWHHGLRHAQHLGMWLTTDDDEVTVHAHVDATEDMPHSHRGFRPAALDGRMFDASSLDGFIGELNVGRDWGALFSERESLFTLQAAGKFVEFGNTLSALMGGLDFIDDVLANVHGQIRLVAAAQEFDSPDRQPSPKLPAFAMVIPVDAADNMQFPIRMQSAVFSALSIFNIERTQAGRAPLLLQTVTVDGQQVVHGKLMPPPGAEEDDTPAMMGPTSGIDGNFEPVVGVFGDRLIVTTSLPLMRGIVASLDDSAKSAPDADMMQFDVAAAVEALRINQTELIAQRMIEKNQSRTDAAADIDRILEAFAMLRHIQLTSDQVDDGVHVSLHLQLADWHHE